MLFRRRELWLPTLWGWLAIAIIGALVLVLFARNVYAFLAPNEPVGARVLVVEGWMDAEGLDQAIAVIRSGKYATVVTTGGPIEHWLRPQRRVSYAEVAADYLAERLGVQTARITAVPSPEVGRERTYRSAILVREWAKRSGLAVDALDIFSWGPHARRTRMLYRLVFGPQVDIGVYAATSPDYAGDTWWRTSIGAKEVIEQAIGLVWQKCFFWPSTSGSR
jgi:hypothetical protein